MLGVHETHQEDTNTTREYTTRNILLNINLKQLETMNKKRLTKKHYAVILTALELSIADRTDEMVELISEIQDIIEPRTTDELIEKWNIESHMDW